MGVSIWNTVHSVERWALVEQMQGCSGGADAGV